MKFRTRYDKPERFRTNPGSAIRITYEGQYDEKGVLDLVEKGKVNIYNEIQSHADSVDIHVILKRYQNGDINALNKIQGVYGDFTDIPNNFTDMLNLMIEKESEFKALPVEIKEKFGNSYEQYMATAGSPEWLTKMGIVKEKTVESAVQENVQVDKPAAE